MCITLNHSKITWTNTYISSAPFFDVTLDVDDQDPSKFVARLSLPFVLFDSVFSHSIDTWYCKDLYEKQIRDLLEQGNNTIDLNLKYEELNKCRVSVSMCTGTDKTRVNRWKLCSLMLTLLLGQLPASFLLICKH